MGAKELNLAEPINKKIFKNYEDQNIRIGICLMQGWRKTMEDTCLAIPNFDGNDNSIFGIFDGHGGSIIAQFVACNIENILKNSKYYKNSNCEKALIDSFIIIDELLKNKDVDIFLKKIRAHRKNTIDTNDENGAGIINKELLKDNIKNDPFTDYLFYCSSDLDHDTNLKYLYPDISPELLSDNFSQTKKIIKYDENDKNKINEISFNNMKLDEINNKTQENENKIKDMSDLIANNIGTTANVLILKKNDIYVANVGDSLSVMYKKKKAYKLNKEHKTTYDKEANRLKKLGTKIQNYRINGKLNITRAIGDLSYKNKTDKYIYEQDVLAIPEVSKYSTDDVDFIVMGSDGFWDYGDDVQTISNTAMSLHNWKYCSKKK